MRAIPTAPCLGLVHTFEGFSADVYADPVGIRTIGYGHALGENPPDPPAPWTQEIADNQAIADLATAATGVCEALGGDDAANRLTNGQYAACIDLAFNIGVGAFTGSTLAHYIKTGAMNLVPAEFLRWTHGRVNGVETTLPGLLRRRQAEVAVWLTTG